MTSLFEDTNLEYRLTEDNRVLVRKVEKTDLSEASPSIHQISFSGQILDKQTRLPLPYATIYCPATNEGCATDEAGNFTLKISSSKTEGTISIQYLGYISKVIPWKKGTDLSNLTIDLQIKSLDFEEVTILESLPTISNNQADGAIVFRANQLNRLPTFVGGQDIFRSLQLLPGISASDDLSSELKIRGSNGDENMVILDGITLYKVDHYFGIFSAINASLVDEVKIFKNAFPVEYGGRTAGVIDLTSHQPTEQAKINGGLQVDLLTTSAYLSLPISDKSGLLIGGRITNKNVANTDLFDLLQSDKKTPDIIQEPTGLDRQATLLKENPDFKFYDFNAKWLWQLSPKTDISVSFFKGYDQFNYNYERTFGTQDIRPNGRIEEVTNTESFEEAAEWDNQGISLQLNHQWTNKLSSYVNIAHSKYEDSQLSTLNLTRQIIRPPNNTSPPTRVDTVLTNVNAARNAVEGKEINIKNDWLITEGQKLTFGYHLVNNEVNFAIDRNNESEISSLVNGTQHSLYAQYHSQLGKFDFRLGLRNTYYTTNQENYISPRISLSYKVNDAFSLKAAGSQYYQFLRQNNREDRFGRSYDFWTLSDADATNFPVASSKQGMLGFSLTKLGFVLDVEAYYKKTEGITEFVPASSGFALDMIDLSIDNLKFFTGTGVSKGIDILLKKDIKKYTSWLAYTLSKTTHSFPEILDDSPFPSQDDRRHQLKWVHQYQWKKFDFAATYIFSSGRPYTDLEKILEAGDRRDLRPKDRISYLKNYQRFDISAGYKFKWGASKGRVGLSIFNVFDRANVKYRQYFFAVPNLRNERDLITEVTGTEVLMLGFTPNLSFSLNF